jgi:hypothetical protein
MAPGVDDPRVVAFARSENRFVAGPREITEGAGLAVNDRRRLINDGPGRAPADHAVAGIVEKPCVVLNRENGILEVLAVGRNQGRIDVRTHLGPNPECFPQVRLGRHDLVETARSLASGGHEQSEARRATGESVEHVFIHGLALSMSKLAGDPT